MRTDSAPTVVRRHDIPEAIRALDVLPSDYVDLFVATTPDAARTTPEGWARAALDEASAAGRFMAWRVALGLRLESQPSPEHVAGWKVVDRGDTWIRIEARSWFMTANIAFQVEEGNVSFATFIRYDNPVAKVVWTPVSAIHRRIAPDVLRAAVRRVHRGIDAYSRARASR